MIRFEISRDGVNFRYEPESGNPNWIHDKLETEGHVNIIKTFTFEKNDLISAPSPDMSDWTEEPFFLFQLATHSDGYYHIAGRILGIQNNLLIADRGIKLKRELFTATRNISIFKRISKIILDNNDIIIGGNKRNNIPINIFHNLINKFPTTEELNRYANARVESVIGDFFDGVKSAREHYEIYLNNRTSSVSDKHLEQKELLQSEVDKYKYLRNVISDWLKEAESRSEKDWQEIIIKLILLIFPKYIAVLENVGIPDFYTSPGKKKKRYIDLCLIDASGNIDIIEIKKPFDNAILSKATYRDNNLPAKELSGSIMQAEKYLFHLSKWGIDGERELSKQYKASLPDGMQIRITNPKAIVILGRDKFLGGQQALSSSQTLDFEVIKRKYANMIDVLTYDDLSRRLNNIIASLTKRIEAT